MPTQRDSPVHQQPPTQDVLRETRVGAVMRMMSVGGIPLAVREHSVRADVDLRTAAETMLNHKLREIQVTDAEGTVIGMLDEADISRFYLKMADDQQKPPEPSTSDTPPDQ